MRRTPIDSPPHEAVSSWEDFQAAVERNRERLSPRGSRTGISAEEVFFRGHADETWELLPTLLREAKRLRLSDEDLMTVEADLFWEFHARAHELHDRELTDWDHLFFMRHHGANTRLLDWTESLGIALYFALNGTSAGPPCVWMLNPYALNELRRGEARDLIHPRYLSNYGDMLNKGEMEWKLPLSIYPDQRSARMRAQRGWFTIHGSSRDPIERSAPSTVAKIILTGAAIDAGKEFLAASGLNEYSVYVDLDALCRDLHKMNGL